MQNKRINSHLSQGEALRQLLVNRYYGFRSGGRRESLTSFSNSALTNVVGPIKTQPGGFNFHCTSFPMCFLCDLTSVCVASGGLSRAEMSLMEVQCHLDREGASDLVIDLIMNATSDRVFHESILLAIALLEGGNTTIQVTKTMSLRQNQIIGKHILTILYVFFLMYRKRLPNGYM